MPTNRRLFSTRTYYFALPLLILLMAVPLWSFSRPVAALGLLVAAALCFFAVKSLVGQIARAQEQKCFLDEQLIQSQKLAAIGELSAGIAHEINNPLAIIVQEVAWARCQFEGKNAGGAGLEEVQDSLREIAKQVERCREITHKMLDFARKHEPLIQGVDLNRLIEDMARLVENEASPRGIEIVRQYRSEIPIIQTDLPLLRQVVLNLLNNASYAIGQNGTITIQTRVPENGFVEMSISDTGCGIPRDNLNKIFDPFFTTKPPGKGTGLGLAICHNIVVRLGGRITVESEPGKGTAFTIRLPVIHTAWERG